MRFMMIIKTDETAPANFTPTPELMDAIGELSNRMMAEGTLLDTGGLLPSAAGAMLRLAGGKVSVTDGPFTEAKELVGGYAILRAGSKAEAIRLGTEFLDLHGKILGPSCRLDMEVRQMMDVTPEGCADEQN